MDDAIAYLTASDLLARYRAKSLSPLEVVEEALDRIERCEPTLNAFQHLDAESARDAARAIDRRITSPIPRPVMPPVQ